MRVEVKGKVIPTSFLKIEEWGTSLGERSGKEGQLVKLVGDQNSGPVAPPRSKIGQEKREQSRYQGRSDCQKSNGEK